MNQEQMWKLARRLPEIIPANEQDGIYRQWAIFAKMTQPQRLDIAMQLSAVALQARRDRLQRKYPHADQRGISWAIIREIEQREPSVDPVIH